MGAGVWRDAAVRDGKPLTSEGAVEGRPALWFGSFASSKLAEVGVLACSLLSWPGSSKGHLSPEVGVVGCGLCSWLGSSDRHLPSEVRVAVCSLFSWLGSNDGHFPSEVGVVACSLFSWPGSSDGHLPSEVVVVMCGVLSWPGRSDGYLPSDEDEAATGCKFRSLKVTPVAFVSVGCLICLSSSPPSSISLFTTPVPTPSAEVILVA